MSGWMRTEMNTQENETSVEAEITGVQCKFKSWVSWWSCSVEMQCFKLSFNRFDEDSYNHNINCFSDKILKVLVNSKSKEPSYYQDLEYFHQNISCNVFSLMSQTTLEGTVGPRMQSVTLGICSHRPLVTSPSLRFPHNYNCCYYLLLIKRDILNTLLVDFFLSTILWFVFV